MSEFNPADPFGFFSQFVKPGEAAAANPFLPPLKEEEIEQKLAELKVVEQWMTMQLGMIQMTQKTLEMQKAGLAAMRQGFDPNPNGTPRG